jgi:hypothetical protein
MIKIFSKNSILIHNSPFLTRNVSQKERIKILKQKNYTEERLVQNKYNLLMKSFYKNIYNYNFFINLHQGIKTSPV